MKRCVSVIFSALMFLMCAAVNAETVSDSAMKQIIYDINSHKLQIQVKSGELLCMEAEELAQADFARYDTSGVLLGSCLYNFGDVDTVEGRRYVHTIVGMKGYPSMFESGTVLRSGKRASVMQDFPDDIPSYQVVAEKRNIYIENIDFYNFPFLKFEYCDNIVINNCTFNNFTDNGLVFRGCSNVAVINSKFVNCGCEITDHTKNGSSLRIAGDRDCPSQNILIENCELENSCGNAISLTGSVDDFVIRNNIIKNSVWSAIDVWAPDISGSFVNVIENNKCINTGFGKPSPNDSLAASSGVGAAAIYTGMGCAMKNTVVKNNVIRNTVETGIEGPYELVWRNTIKNTGENSKSRSTPSSEAVYIKLTPDFEQKYICNDIKTRGTRCFSSYSDSDEEYAGVYIIGNTLNLEKETESIEYKYKRCDISINCPRLKRLIIRDNKGMQTETESVYIYIRDKDYQMEQFDLENPCKIGAVPERSRYLYNINTLKK